MPQLSTPPKAIRSAPAYRHYHHTRLPSRHGSECSASKSSSSSTHTIWTSTYSSSTYTGAAAGAAPAMAVASPSAVKVALQGLQLWRLMSQHPLLAQGGCLAQVYCTMLPCMQHSAVHNMKKMWDIIRRHTPAVCTLFHLAARSNQEACAVPGLVRQPRHMLPAHGSMCTAMVALPTSLSEHSHGSDEACKCVIFIAKPCQAV